MFQRRECRQCPQPRKCTKEGCSSSHNNLLHGSERIFPQKVSGEENKGSTGTSTKVSHKSTGSESSGMPSVSDVKGLLQITEVELESLSCSGKALVLCDSACSHSWISKRLADKLHVKGSPTKLTVHGTNSQQLIDTEMVEFKLTPVHSGGSCSSFPMKPFVRNDLKIGNDFIDVDNLKAKYPHLEPISLSRCSYADFEMILDQGVFQCYPPIGVLHIRPCEYSDCRSFTVGLGIEWSTSISQGSFLDLFESCC